MEKKSLFNKSAGSKKPFKHITIQELPNALGAGADSVESTELKVILDNSPLSGLEKLGNIPEKKGKDVNRFDNTPKLQDKSTPKLNPFFNINRLENEGTSVERFDNTAKLENEGTTVERFDNTPKLENEGTTVERFDNTAKLENEGTTVEDFDNTAKLENEGTTVEDFDNTAKLENEGKDVEKFDNLPKLETQAKDHGEMKFLRKSILSSMTSEYSMDGKGKESSEFTQDFNEGIPSQYVEDSSTLDDLNQIYSYVNRYEGVISQIEDGKYPESQEKLIKNSSNKLVLNHWEDIGSLNLPGEGNNVNQAVDFQNEQYSGFTHPIPNPFVEGFTQSPIFKNTLFVDVNSEFSRDDLDLSIPSTFYNRWQGIDIPISNRPFTNSNLDKLYNFYSYDPRSEFFEIGSRIRNVNSYNGTLFDGLAGNESESLMQNSVSNFVGADNTGKLLKLYDDQFMDYRENRIFFGKNIPINSTNPYKGSAFDDVKSFSFNPFAASVNDHSKYEDYVGLIAGLPYVNVGDTNLEVDIPLSLYNNYKFDPRENYMVLGNSISGQKNITFLNKNNYFGSKFDDGVGKIFNEQTKYDEFFNSIEGEGHFPNFSDIVLHGNITTSTDSSNIGSGYSSLSLTYERYLNTGGRYAGDDVLESSTSKYFENGEIKLENSSWYYGEQKFPNTNLSLESSFDTQVGNRTITINGISEDDGTISSKTLTGQFFSNDSDLNFTTLYNKNQNSKIYSNLDINYTSTDRVGMNGLRGAEPYVITPIPDSTTEDPRPNDGSLFSLNRSKRYEQDKHRIESFLESEAGVAWTSKQKKLYKSNIRVNKSFSNDTLLDVVKTGALRSYADPTDLLYTQWGTYSSTVYENLTRPFGVSIPSVSHPNDAVDIILLVTNQLHAYDVGGIPFLGGNAFQALGFNKFGVTNKSNVTPRTLEDIVKDNLLNLLNMAAVELSVAGGKASLIQTEWGGRSSATNPRYLAYTQKNTSKNDESNKSSLDGTPNLQKVLGEGGIVPGQPNIGSEKKKPLEIGPYSKIPKESGEGGNAFTNFDLAASITDPKLRYTESGGVTDKGGIPSSLDPRKSVNQSGDFGDFHTMIPITNGINNDAEKPSHGAPFYFKDLRDNAYVYFRGYVESVNENFQPTWNEESYLGRSENVYSYERTSRDVSFTLKMYANSKPELHMLYDKMEKLTSMVYPQWVSAAPMDKLRGKPPLMQFRYGELFGKRHDELFGFIRSLTYSYPDNSTWETIQGQRVPKFVTAAITLQVLHNDVPGMYTKFHGMPLSHPIHQVDASQNLSLVEQSQGGVQTLAQAYPDTLGINEVAQ